MRMISERDGRIMSVLSRHADNDMNLVRDALEEVTQRPRARDSKIPLQEAIEVIERLKEERIDQPAL